MYAIVKDNKCDGSKHEYPSNTYSGSFFKWKDDINAAFIYRNGFEWKACNCSAKVVEQ